MGANTAQIFPGTPRDPQVRISTANTGRDGTGTLGTVYTASALTGAFFKGIRIQAEGTVGSADVVRIFIQNGGVGNKELIKECLIPATTPSDTVEAASYEWYPKAGIQLGAASVVYASTDQGNTYSVSLLGGGDYDPSGNVLLSMQCFPMACTDMPTSSDWAVNSVAPLEPDPSNSSIIVAQMVQGSETGRGFESLYVPTNATKLRLTFWYRAVSAPGAARTVGLKLYHRERDTDTTIPSWANDVLTDLAVPADANYQKQQQSIPLSTFGTPITAGSLVQFQLNRVAPQGGTELTVDCLMNNVIFEWLS